MRIAPEMPSPQERERDWPEKITTDVKKHEVDIRKEESQQMRERREHLNTKA